MTATKSSVYEAYLQNWNELNPDIKTPVVVRQFDSAGGLVAELFDTANDLGHIGKYLSYGNQKSKLAVLDNGQCIEVGSDSRGCFLYGLWNSVDAALAFKKADSYRVFYGDW